MSTPADALRAALGDPAGIPADRLDAYWAAIVRGAETAPPPPSAAAERTRLILGPDIRAARTQAGRGAAA